MSFSERTDGKYNRKSEYFLVSVKERNMDEFIATLEKDKRRHAEPKADEVLALGPNQRHKNKNINLGELFYLINSYNSLGSSSYFYLNRLEKIILDQIDKDYLEMGKTKPDLSAMDNLRRDMSKDRPTGIKRDWHQDNNQRESG